MEEMLVHDFVVAELEPEDDSVPDRDQTVEQDREEDVVIKAREVGNAGKVFSDVKLRGIR